MDKDYIKYAVIVCIMAISAGVIVHIISNNVMKKETVKQAEKFNLFSNIQRDENVNNIKETSNSDIKTTPNTVFIFETLYEKCGHSVIEKEQIKKEDVNKTEQEIKEKYVGWEVKKFSSDEIYFFKKEERMCKNHFKIREENGKVAIYYIDQDGNESLKEETDILTKYLPNEDVELLNKGIMANNETELDNILSDYE